MLQVSSAFPGLFYHSHPGVFRNSERTIARGGLINVAGRDWHERGPGHSRSSVPSLRTTCDILASDVLNEGLTRVVGMRRTCWIRSVAKCHGSLRIRTMTGPVCECHPTVPPGVTLLLLTATSTGPLESILTFEFVCVCMNFESLSQVCARH